MFTYIQPCTTDWLVFDKQWRKQAIPLAPIFFSRSLSLSLPVQASAMFLNKMNVQPLSLYGSLCLCLSVSRSHFVSLLFCLTLSFLCLSLTFSLPFFLSPFLFFSLFPE